MKAREGDLIETLDGNIFDVKGLVHPSNRIIAFIRFTPDSKGERKRDNTRYRKVYPLHERYALLQERFPKYLVFDSVFNQWLCEVPIEAVKKHYKPTECLSHLRRKPVLEQLEEQTLELAQLLQKNAGVRWSALGVSGSLLVGLHTSTSDIDLVVYGSKDCQRVYETLKTLVHNETGYVKSYTKQELRALFDFRSKDTKMRFEDFVRTESRKVLQGKFQQSDYFIRCVKDWSEVGERYGGVHYKSIGYAKIKATINDDSETIFTPCTYKINGAEILEGAEINSISEIVSFRGRFCEQAKKGEIVIAQGSVEHLRGVDGRESYRMLLGNQLSDYLIHVNNF